MAVTDMYTPVHGHTHSEVEGAYYQATHHDHASCPYLALFAVPLIGDIAQPTIAPDYFPAFESLLILSAVPHQQNVSKFHWARGPPPTS